MKTKKQSVVAKFAPILPPPNSDIIKVFDWLNYGRDNLFPQKIAGYKSISPTHSSCIDAKTNLCAGNGINPFVYEENESVLEFLEAASLDNFSMKDFMLRVFKDFNTFNGFSFQVLRNKENRIVSVMHIPFANVRRSFPNEYNETENFYISDDWTNRYIRKFAPLRYKGYQPGKIRAKIEIVYYYEYDPLLRFYPLPEWFSCINSIETESRIQSFSNSYIKNNMMPSTIVSLPNTPTDEQLEELQKNIENNLTGEDNAGKFLILFGRPDTNGGSQHAQITPVQPSDKANLYNETDANSVQKILSAHRIPSPTIVGLPGAGSLGGNGNELEAAQRLFQTNVIQPKQDKFIEIFRLILKDATGYSGELRIKPLISNYFSENVKLQTLTKNELRSEQGFPAREGGDVLPGASNFEKEIGKTGNLFASKADQLNKIYN